MNLIFDSIGQNKKYRDRNPGTLFILKGIYLDFNLYFNSAWQLQFH
jgi:hypothetical protein